MKRLRLHKPVVGLALLLMIAQAACNLGSALATSAPITPAAPSQSTQAASAPSEAAATSTGEHASPAEAQAMLKAAVDHYQSVGREQALKDFNEKKPPFTNRDLYVVCLGADHTMTANGEYPMLVGMSADAIKDTTGKPLGQAVWDVVSAQPQGSMPFHWDNPLTGQPESKILYYQKLDQDVCGVAAAQP
jgi:cytochrome c